MKLDLYSTTYEKAFSPQINMSYFQVHNHQKLQNSCQNNKHTFFHQSICIVQCIFIIIHNICKDSKQCKNISQTITPQLQLQLLIPKDNKIYFDL